jgi:catechol 2,3-dioxygenase-like lactoylglutathione lyase family enzyme
VETSTCCWRPDQFCRAPDAGRTPTGIRRLEPHSPARGRRRRRLDRLRAAGVTFRSEIVRGPGGSQIVFDDPSGNPVELFQPSA